MVECGRGLGHDLATRTFRQPRDIASCQLPHVWREELTDG